MVAAGWRLAWCAVAALAPDASPPGLTSARTASRGAGAGRGGGLHEGYAQWRWWSPWRLEAHAAYPLYFDDYVEHLPEQNYSISLEMARPIDDFSDDGESYIKIGPYWDDGNAVRAQLRREDQSWNNELAPGPGSGAPGGRPGKFMVILHPDDPEALETLQQHFPGDRRHPPQGPGRPLPSSFTESDSPDDRRDDGTAPRCESPRRAAHRGADALDPDSVASASPVLEACSWPCGRLGAGGSGYTNPQAARGLLVAILLLGARCALPASTGTSISTCTPTSAF